jgi:transposase
MGIKSIDFTKPLLLEDEAETLSIERLAAIVGGSVATIRRWMYEEGIIPY